MLLSRKLEPLLSGFDDEIDHHDGLPVIRDLSSVVHLDLSLLIPSELVTQGNTLEADAGVELVEADTHLSEESVVQFVDDPVDLVDGGLEITAAVGVVEQDVALAQTTAASRGYGSILDAAFWEIVFSSGPRRS